MLSLLGKFVGPMLGVLIKAALRWCLSPDTADSLRDRLRDTWWKFHKTASEGTWKWRVAEAWGRLFEFRHSPDGSELWTADVPPDTQANLIGALTAMSGPTPDTAFACELIKATCKELNVKIPEPTVKP